jgi:hypothetical protein
VHKLPKFWSKAVVKILLQNHTKMLYFLPQNVFIKLRSTKLSVA